jgi:hypothetical protein
MTDRLHVRIRQALLELAGCVTACDRRCAIDVRGFFGSECTCCRASKYRVRTWHGKDKENNGPTSIQSSHGMALMPIFTLRMKTLARVLRDRVASVDPLTGKVRAYMVGKDGAKCPRVRLQEEGCQDT